MITRKEIQETVEEEVQIALLSHPNHKWAHPYKGLKHLTAKGKFGNASSKGHIGISQVFEGTMEYKHLRNTVRHEIAHLMVGCHNHHNNTWYHMARALGCDGRRTSTAHNELAQNMKRKWLLVGILADGTERTFQDSHNKMSKYLRAKPLTFTCNSTGQKIRSFKYIRNS